MPARLLAVLTLLCVPCIGVATPLDDYVAAPDDTYQFTIENAVRGEGHGVAYTIYQVKMYSQRWRTIAEVDRPVWWHWLQIVVPDTVTNDVALLVIEGGSNRGNPANVEPFAGMLAGATGAVLALLQQVPNQPLRFSDESIDRREDAIIAYSYDKFLDTGDPTWPVLLPMVKSAVRAMDTVQAVLREKSVNVERFVVGGGSKRGWTTWLTAAVDKRVMACVPIVIDVLNMRVQMDHHHKAYGTYSDAVRDYVDMNVFGRFGTPRAEELLKIVDPYEYRQRFTMPKFVINATGDEFFVLDSSRFYYDSLPEPKVLRYFPNSGHGINADISAAMSLVQFYKAVTKGEPLPRVSWTFEPGNAIRVQTDGSEAAATLWQATNPNERDFRWYDGKGPQWTSSALLPIAERTYEARVPRPAQGWTAFLVELSYPSGLVLSTEVYVVPDCLPYDDTDSDGGLNRHDDDDDGDGIRDTKDTYPCDRDNNAIPDAYENTTVGRRVAVAAQPAANRWAGLIVLAGILGGLLLIAGMLLRRLTR